MFACVERSTAPNGAVAAESINPATNVPVTPAPVDSFKVRKLPSATDMFRIPLESTEAVTRLSPVNSASNVDCKAVRNWTWVTSSEVDAAFAPGALSVSVVVPRTSFKAFVMSKDTYASLPTRTSTIRLACVERSTVDDLNDWLPNTVDVAAPWSSPEPATAIVAAVTVVPAGAGKVTVADAPFRLTSNDADW